MSGIVAVYNVDGGPVDPRLLERMTEHMAFRGPDAQGVWVEGQVGLGHTLFGTTDQALDERQPLSLDERVWITTDARIDDRAHLAQKLRSRGAAIPQGATDAELILRAYQVWGEDCVQHLLGDFAFAIWDGRRQQLFGARDQLGVKPFYYAQVAGCIVLGNTLSCVRLHPAVPSELNEQAIGDFLLFGTNRELDTTVFAAIKRLAPAHCLRWSKGGLSVRSYWTLPADNCLEYRRAGDYVDHFSELLRTAVVDRLRTKRVAVAMSGGLDSTTVASIARDALAEQGGAFDLQAFTVIYQRLILDPERHFAAIAADALGIPISFFEADGYVPYGPSDYSEHGSPEPSNDPLKNKAVAFYHRIAKHSRVALTGWDGDVTLNEPPNAHWVDVARRGRLLALISHMGWYAWSQRRVPPVGIRNWLRDRRQARDWRANYPTWLNRSFARRANLEQRWRESLAAGAAAHSTHPRARRMLTAPMVPQLFEELDAGVTGVPLEMRHPLFDLRVVSFLLSIPVIPWCTSKELIRRAVRGKLPEEIRLRPKTPMLADPVSAYLREFGIECVAGFGLLPELRSYVAQEAIPEPSGQSDDYRLWMSLLPFSLNSWLQRVRQPDTDQCREAR